MERVAITPRADWQSRVESQGMFYHTLDDVPYWDESAYYRFSARQIDELERATYALNDMCLEAVEHVVNRAEELFPHFQIPPALYQYVIRSWHRDEITIYGRYDLAYDGEHPPRMLEFNADTPTALLEAAVIQWSWLKDRQAETGEQLDQFNSIHERLIEAWKRYRPKVHGRMYFTGLEDALEDYMTVSYLRDTAIQASLETGFVPISEVRWDAAQEVFVRGVGQERTRAYHEEPMLHLFKLYPWEWLAREPFGEFLIASRTTWLEAPWKMLLSNKAILPILWQLHPESDYLLRAEFDPFEADHVKKPILAREGACVSIVEDGRETEATSGMELYQQSPSVYQEYCPLPCFDGNHPVIGSWLVNGWACGIGIREDRSRITGNASRFVPHAFTPE